LPRYSGGVTSRNPVFPVKNQTMRNASKLFAVSPFAPMQQNMHAGGQTGGNKK
jgi:hypothetical protein